MIHNDIQSDEEFGSACIATYNNMQKTFTLQHDELSEDVFVFSDDDGEKWFTVKLVIEREY